MAPQRPRNTRAVERHGGRGGGIDSDSPSQLPVSIGVLLPHLSDWCLTYCSFHTSSDRTHYLLSSPCESMLSWVGQHWFYPQVNSAPSSTCHPIRGLITGIISSLCFFVPGQAVPAFARRWFPRPRFSLLVYCDLGLTDAVLSCACWSGFCVVLCWKVCGRGADQLAVSGPSLEAEDGQHTRAVTPTLGLCVAALLLWADTGSGQQGWFCFWLLISLC